MQELTLISLLESAAEGNEILGCLAGDLLGITADLAEGDSNESLAQVLESNAKGVYRAFYAYLTATGMQDLLASKDLGLHDLTSFALKAYCETTKR